MPEGSGTVPTDTSSNKIWGLYDPADTFFYYARRTLGHGWWVGAKTQIIRANFTRPADTTAYAAGDAITNSTSAPTVITFSGMAARNGGSGLIVAAGLVSSVNAATDLVADLVICDTTFTAVNDNAAFVLSDTEARTVLGVVQFATPVDIGANNTFWGVYGLNIPYVCGASSTSLFGMLVARNAYTPANAERFDLQLLVQLD